MTKISTLAAATAAISLLATPVAAAELPVSVERSTYAEPGYDTAADQADRYRRYRHRRYRNRVDAGDVIAGVAILGTIAAIASASSRNKRDRYDNRRYPQRDPRRSYNSSNLDRAVSSCMREIERDVRVESVDNVGRAANGWQVSGRLYDGNNFTCNVGQNGRIDRIDYGQGSAFSGAASGGGDTQWSDDAYAQARLNAGSLQPTPAVPTEPAGPQPAYPGGPIDGDLGG
ncbi:hypothetical protein OAS19_05000 [Altererythrobacter sp.]|nr:hypothetical protein [Altererythrobacter sp.]